jgi:23S rRNA (cytidine1920-2'-O)/16S rRNA (cytidine1409-2'-O)-methyltransferase
MARQTGSAPPSARARLDAQLVASGAAESRARAQALILAGKVTVNGARATRAGQLVTPEDVLGVADVDGFASRGAFKLLHAVEAFPVLREAIAGAGCLDIGASTGGFTDVLLRHGAAQVVALDVGYGQLHERLRTDPRVIVRDRTNIRHLGPGELPFAPAVATCDASFISVTLFLDVVLRELAHGGLFAVLVKPQFEVGRELVGKGGVVRDEATRQSAAAKVREAAVALGFEVVGQSDSPLAGPSGNREILLVLRKPGFLSRASHPGA